MHMKGLDLNLLIVFDALLCEKNVTCAAQKLGLSQSAVSHALARLRTFFDDPLFIKGAVGMEPTPRALQLRAPIGRILLEVRQHIQSPTPFEPALARRQFTLALTDLGEVVMLPTLLRQFRQLAPRCTLRSVQIPPEQMEQALAGGELDLAVGAFPSPAEVLFQQRLYDHTFVVLGSSHNSQLHKGITRELFESLPHVAVKYPGRLGACYDAVLEQLEIRRNICLTTPHFLTIPFLLEQNPDLIATVPLELGLIFAQSRHITLLPPPILLPSFTLRQYWHPHFHDDAANQWLRQLIRHTFENYPEVEGNRPLRLSAL